MSVDDNTFYIHHKESLNLDKEDKSLLEEYPIFQQHIDTYNNKAISLNVKVCKEMEDLLNDY